LRRRAAGYSRLHDCCMLSGMVVACPSCSHQNRLPAARLDARAKCGSCKAQLLPLEHPVAVLSTPDFDELVKDSPLPVLVDFWAAWCGPCRVVAPQVDLLAKKNSGKLVAAKVDTDALTDVAARFSIRGIPTLVLFREGKEQKRVSGAMSADAIAKELGIGN
jgi:thioredoxin 2